MRPHGLFLVFLLACGGRVDGVDGPRCPAPDQVNAGEACAVEGMQCGSSLPAVDPCTGQPNGQTQCSCAGGTWACDVQHTCNQPPQCPPAADVVYGASCSDPGLMCESAQSYTACDGTHYAVSCTCSAADLSQSGTWACPNDMPECPDAGPPPPSCPDPASVQAGASCSQAGQQCPGNPQLCGGSTFYDAFQCESGQWVDVAPTVCDTDAGADGSSDGGADAGDDGG